MRVHTRAQQHNHTGTDSCTHIHSRTAHVDTRGCARAQFIAGRRRSTMPRSKACMTWRGCSSPTARTSPRGTPAGPPSAHAGAAVPLGLYSLKRSDRSIVAGCILGRTFGHAAQQCTPSPVGRTCCVRVCIGRVLKCTIDQSPHSHRTDVAGGDARRLCRRTPRDVAADKGAFDAAVKARRPVLSLAGGAAVPRALRWFAR
jgi:hypothetical protein